MAAETQVIEVLEAIWTALVADNTWATAVKANNRIRPDQNDEPYKDGLSDDDVPEAILTAGRFRDYLDPQVRTLCGERRVRDQDYNLVIVGSTLRLTTPNVIVVRTADLIRTAAKSHPPFGLSYVERVLDITGAPEETARREAAGKFRLLYRCTVSVRMVIEDGS